VRSGREVFRWERFVSSSGIWHSDILRQFTSSEPRRAHHYVQSEHASRPNLVERRGRVLGFYRVQTFIYLNPLHPTEQRYRHPAGPRYDRVEHRVHNVCRSLCAQIGPRGLKLLFVPIKLPRFLDMPRVAPRPPHVSQNSRKMRETHDKNLKSLIG
jgi:hypothetical protein